MKNLRPLFVLGLLLVIMVGGCGPSQAPVYPQVIVWSGKPNEARYAATPQEGIDFRKDGYPDFLAEVSGVSGLETWGRWTDAAMGSAATFRFRQPLPKKFTVQIVVHSISVAQIVKVRVGTSEKEVTIQEGGAAPTTYDVPMESDGTADSLAITSMKLFIPHEHNPNSADVRKLGIPLQALKILS